VRLEDCEVVISAFDLSTGLGFFFVRPKFQWRRVHHTMAAKRGRRTRHDMTWKRMLRTIFSSVLNVAFTWYSFKTADDPLMMSNRLVEILQFLPSIFRRVPSWRPSEPLPCQNKTRQDADHIRSQSPQRHGNCRVD